MELGIQVSQKIITLNLKKSTTEKLTIHHLFQYKKVNIKSSLFIAVFAFLCSQEFPCTTELS